MSSPLPIEGEVLARLSLDTVGILVLATTIECRMQNAKCGVQNAECGVQNAECGVQNAERGVQNAECRVQSAECRMQSAECRMRNYSLYYTHKKNAPKGVFVNLPYVLQIAARTFCHAAAFRRRAPSQIAVPRKL